MDLFFYLVTDFYHCLWSHNTRPLAQTVCSLIESEL